MRLTSELGNDGSGQRIPVGQNRAGLDNLVGLDRQDRAVRHLVAFALAAVFAFAVILLLGSDKKNSADTNERKPPVILERFTLEDPGLRVLTSSAGIVAA